MAKQGSLFPTENDPIKNDQEQINLVKGLSYIPDFISSQEEEMLVTSIDESTWLSDLSRRVQHYGYKYDYKKRRIDYNMYIGNLPEWTKGICKRLVDEGFFKALPDQIIVNEYQPGQGIASHIDCEPCFNGTVVSLSLASSIVMNFQRPNTKDKIDVLLEPKSIVVLKDEARYNWYHSIAKRKSDMFQHEKIQRKRRISLTFRKVILD